MPPQRRRIGCLGQLVLLGLLGVAVVVGTMAVTNPWIFTVGHRLRLLPFWVGAGDVQGPGGTYRIFVWLQPSNTRSGVLASTGVRGSGWICAPSGHSYQVRVGGGTNQVVWRDMNERPFTLYTWQRRTWSTERLPPKLAFVGHWVGPNLVMQDKGTTASVILPDGSLNPRPGAPGPTRDILFVETRCWFGRPCGSGPIGGVD